MAAEPCSSCDGDCCFSDIDNAYCDHINPTFHCCDWCDDGTARRTAAQERADVLAYLAYATAFPFPNPSNTSGVLTALRDLIEQGMHEGWAKKEMSK